MSTSPARVGKTSTSPPIASGVRGVIHTSNTVKGHLEGGHELRRRGWVNESFISRAKLLVLKWMHISRRFLQCVERTNKDLTVVLQLL